MNSNSPKDIYDDINPVDKLQEIQTFLTGYEIQVFTNKDKEYEYLEDGQYCITLKNANGNPLYIDLTDEFTLTYQDWHSHYGSFYGSDKEEYKYMLNDLRGLLNNTSYIFSIYSTNRWECSELIDYELTSIPDIKRKIESRGKELIHRIKQDGAEVRLSFWDEVKNKVIYLEPER